MTIPKIMNSKKIEYKIKIINKNLNYRNKNLVECLVKHGADINKINKNGETPINYAIYRKDFDIKRYLLNHGARNQSTTTKSVNAEETVKQARRASATNEDHNFMKQVCCPIESGNKDLVEYLVENGSGINKEDKFYETSLFHANPVRNYDIKKYLLRH
ncbi:ankyrin repeat-containing domain protein [Neocallimastix lanati (nom. inval.)]|nr:ankyrin repeat-containing domain protein [Neocallimastix sp. JGI-2020a]